MSASGPVPEEEEDDAEGAVSEHKVTSDTRAEGGPPPVTQGCF